MREQTGVAAGDEVDFTIELDSEPRTLNVPEDLAAALDRDPRERKAFDGLSYSNQKRHVLAVREQRRTRRASGGSRGSSPS